MPLYTVASFDYGPLFKKLMKSRLDKALPAASVCGETDISLSLNVEPSRLGSFALALAELLTEDLRAAETARLVSLLPLDLRDRRSVLPAALASVTPRKWVPHAAEALCGYLECERLMVAEGFLRFRLPEVVEDWAIAVDRAGEELLLRRERRGLMRLLADVMEEGNPGSGRLRLILHGENGCTLTDEKGFRLEGAGAAEPGIMGLLLGLSPESLEVYDLTEGGPGPLTEAIREVFGSRARIFVKRS